LEDYDEFLAKTETEIDAERFSEGGITRFAGFNLQVFVDLPPLLTLLRGTGRSLAGGALLSHTGDP
jgi:hypothetical protein